MSLAFFDRSPAGLQFGWGYEIILPPVPPPLTLGLDQTIYMREGTVHVGNYSQAQGGIGAITYTLGGTDSAEFTMSPTTGSLTLNSIADQETKDTYTVTVTVEDDVDIITQYLTIVVVKVVSNLGW